MKTNYLLIDYMADDGPILQVRCFHKRQNAIEEGKRSLEYDYDNGYFKKRYKEHFREYPSLEELLDQWEKLDYRYYNYLEIMECEVCD